MKAYLADVLLAASMTSVTAFAASSPPLPWQHGTVRYATYTNKSFGFSVQYPATWKTGPSFVDHGGEYFHVPSGVRGYYDGESPPPKTSDVVLAIEGVVNGVYGVGVGQNFAQMTRAI